MNAPAESQPAIVMRRATDADAPALMEFYQRHFPGRPRLNNLALWNWEFAGQPGAQQKFPFFVLDSGRRIEGGIGFTRFNLHAGGQISAGLLPVNFFVNPGFKGLHALRLFRAMLSEAPIVLGSYISEAAAQLVKRSGFVDLSAHYNAYHLPLRFITPATSLTGTLRATALQLVRRLWLSLLGAYTLLCTLGIRYCVAESLNQEWLQYISNWRLANCCIAKNADYITWRYSSPVLACRYIWQLRGGKPIGLAVMHLDQSRGEAVLLDCIAESSEPWALLGLLAKTIRDARRGRARLWITHTLSAPLEHALRTLSCGWSRSPLGLTVLCTDTRLHDAATDPRGWHVMVGDTDVY